MSGKPELLSNNFHPLKPPSGSSVVKRVHFLIRIKLKSAFLCQATNCLFELLHFYLFETSLSRPNYDILMLLYEEEYKKINKTAVMNEVLKTLFFSNTNTKNNGEEEKLYFCPKINQSNESISFRKTCFCSGQKLQHVIPRN